MVVYVLFLLTIDLFFNLIVNLLQRNPGALIVASTFIRLFSLALLFPVVLIIVHGFLKNQGINIIMVVSSVIVYISIPLIIYFLKDNQKGVLEVYKDLHFDRELFVLIFIPYIIATFCCLILINKFKLF
jgi:Na+-driven multidrug efflux pump